MSNLKIYKNVFKSIFSIGDERLNDGLEYNTIEAWDSVGHMGLIAALEEAFEIEMETDDIINFSSYQKGFELLRKYGIEL